MPRTAPILLALCALLAPAVAQPPAAPPATPPATTEPAKPQAPKPAPQPDPQPVTQPVPAPAPANPAPLLSHIEVRGTGPIPLILIPPFVCDWAIYDAFMTRNADRYTMYAVTLPGFGKSDPPPPPPDGIPYSIAPWLESAVRGVVQLIDDRALDKPVILGVSTGGHIALRVGIAAPDKIRGVVTLNGLPAIPLNGTTLLPQVTRDRIVREEFAGYWQTCPEAEWTRQQEDWIRASFPNPDRAKIILASAAGIPKTTSGRYMLEYFASDLSDKLSSLNLPVLAISSLPAPTDSKYQSLKDSWKAAFAKLPQAKVAFFEACGEILTEDSPAELDTSLQQFLAGKAVDGKAALLDKPLKDRPSNVQPVPAAPPPATPKPPEPK